MKDDQTPETHSSTDPVIPSADTGVPAPTLKPNRDPEITPIIQAKLDENKRLNFRALLITLGSVGLASLYIFILTQIGSSSDEYAYVQSLSNQATSLSLIVAAITGAYVAYKVAHPTRVTRNPNSKTPIGWVVAIILGFIVGILPGIILLLCYLILARGGSSHTADTNPSAPLQLKPASAGLIILGFVAGAIPGLIWVLAISYPLSQHACRLSGSKYC